MYGTSLAQSMHYVWFFPDDLLPIKLLVCLAFLSILQFETKPAIGPVCVVGLSSSKSCVSVGIMFFSSIADILHLIGTTEFYWTMLVLCHRRDTASCEIDLPW